MTYTAVSYKHHCLRELIPKSRIPSSLWLGSHFEVDRDSDNSTVVRITVDHKLDDTLTGQVTACDKSNAPSIVRGISPIIDTICQPIN